MARVHGRRGQIEIASAGSPGAGSPIELDIICSLASWTLNFTRDKVDVTSFCDDNKVYLAGLKDVSGTFEGFFDSDYIAAIDTASESEVGTYIKITPSLTYPNISYEGPAWLDYSVTGAVADAVKISGSISANGSWTKSFA
jgi:hypothetical protein